MGLLDTPPDADFWMKAYSYFLKFEGNVFLGIFFVAYILKWGVAWHDAGDPFNLTDIKFSAYWDMILIIYTTLGFYIVQASLDPNNFKPLLSWAMWGGNFAHGCVAFAHCFADVDKPWSKYTKDTLGGRQNVSRRATLVWNVGSQHVLLQEGLRQFLAALGSCKPFCEHSPKKGRARSRARMLHHDEEDNEGGR
eukprot:CAMPEP_0180796048 /NCGR_PEP_ID=MMETSP1038_2-20121128/56557_1 /TAXON_ID=632150 /ORGANISM="Azadinium spinosum, Strain 3D9" /LENGTH=193 /DNA_ID=CAMNT_0022835073 /DNA_START=19 /DNA_END=597 /DNA_ORIENTATION=+